MGIIRDISETSSEDYWWVPAARFSKTNGIQGMLERPIKGGVKNNNNFQKVKYLADIILFLIYVVLWCRLRK